MKTMAVEITVEQSATVYIRVPNSWDPKRMQQEFSNKDVMAEALEQGNPCWNTTGDYTVTYISKPGPNATVDYIFPDEAEQLDWVGEAA